MKYYILYNPLAGNNTSEDKTRRLGDKLQDGELFYVDVTKTDYTELLSRISVDDKIVVSGGDGTMNKFVNAIDGYELKCEVLYYPTGTGNDFFADIGGKDGELIRVNEYVVDLPEVEVNGKKYKFINGIGYGIDGYCCEVGDAMRASGKKNINYTTIAIKGLLFHYKPRNAEIIVDGVSKSYRKVWLAPCMNGKRYGGGMLPTPKQDRLSPDGNVSVMVYYGKGKLKTLCVFPSIFTGEHVKHTEMIEVLEGHEITVKFDSPAPLQIDGETILDVTEYTVRSRAALKSEKNIQTA